MSQPLDIQIARRARELIADKRHWCQGSAALDARYRRAKPESPDAVRFCAYGALRRATFVVGLSENDADHAIDRIAARMVPGVRKGDDLQPLYDANDNCRHSEIIALFRKAEADLEGLCSRVERRNDPRDPPHFKLLEPYASDKRRERKRDMTAAALGIAFGAVIALAAIVLIHLSPQ